MPQPTVLALAGGVGGAKLAHGLAQILPPQNLTILVNTGDDFEHFGLHISPDLDTVCYTLAGLANPQTGWGRADETWNALQTIRTLGGPNWFNLGDADLGLHLERTRRLRTGEPLSRITADFCRALGIAHTILPMSDHPVRTIVETAEGDLPFQDYFVRLKCAPIVTGFRFAGAEEATPAPGVLAALKSAHILILCPSNPWVSIAPILATLKLPSPIRAEQTESFPSPYGREARGEGVRVAVSPIIAGQAIKGPAAKMFAELGITPSAFAVAQHYRGLLTHFVLDSADADQTESIRALGMQPIVLDTLMHTPTDRARLAAQILTALPF